VICGNNISILHQSKDIVTLAMCVTACDLGSPWPWESLTLGVLQWGWIWV